MEEMVRAKYLDIDLMPGMKNWWYGYGESFVRRWKGSSICCLHVGWKTIDGGVRSGVL
jgi:hypothetical protein